MRWAAHHKLITGMVCVAGLMVLYAYLDHLNLIQQWGNTEAIKQHIQQAGNWGPLLIVGLMALAIVLSPIPSAPIALAAGAAYGHGVGTLYVIIGAETGALIAFGLARLTGADLIHRYLGEQIKQTLIGSQNALTLMVLTSRLIPFVSFDVVSYAAGLSPLHLWRFALATLLGIIPASFALAHIGSEMISTETNNIALSLILLGVITLIPWLASTYYKSRRKGPN